jgi:serine/threonine-protein kinase
MDVASRANAERYPERESAAREQAEALKKRLSFLTVQVHPDTAVLAGVGISRNGVPLGPAAWGTRIPIDPGPHVVVAKAPGHEPFSANVTIGDAPQSETIVVPKLRPIPAVPTAAPAPRASNEGRPELLGVRLTPLRTAGVALGTAAVASFGIATFSALRALDKNAESEKNCDDDDCEPAGAADRAAAVEAASIATVSALAGGVLLATGITLFLIGAPDSDGTSVSITPSGLRLRSAF